MSIETEEDFITLIKRAEQDAELNPKSYTTKLALFAMLGYAVIFLVLLALIALGGGVVATAFLSTGLFLLLLKKKLIFAILIGVWVLLRALWVKFAPPQGYTLKRKEFPALFGELDGLSKRLKALKIHEVILDKSLNAAVVQHPRLGVLGWHKNFMIIGYQLLLTLSPQEMRSVLAHEMGHLSGNHSRFSGWIYRVRLTWMRVMHAFEQMESWGAALMRKFFNWYSPRFEAYSFALARSNEYEADAIAAELTSPEIAARALVNVHATAPYVDQRYWDSYFRYADEEAEPPHPPFAGLVQFLRDNPLTEDEMQARVKNEMAVDTHYADTHPSLGDRVHELGVEGAIPVPPQTSAAEAWLGDRNQVVMEDFDQEWLSEHAESWKQRYEYVSDAKARLLEYSQAQPADMSDEDLWGYAYVTQEFGSNEAALPLFRAFQGRYPEDPAPAFFIGLTLLEQGDATGLDQLRLALKNPRLIERAAQAGYGFLKQQGKDEEAEVWWRASIEQNQVYIAAQQERESIEFNDEFDRPKISDELLNQLIANLKRQKKVGKAWLAEKVVEHFPESPVYIIAISPKGFTFSGEGTQAKVAKALDVDGTFFVVCKSGDTKALAKKVIGVGKRIL